MLHGDGCTMFKIMIVAKATANGIPSIVLTLLLALKIADMKESMGQITTKNLMESCRYKEEFG